MRVVIGRVAMVAVVGVLLSASTANSADKVLVRLDLDSRTHFDKARALGIEARHRNGNVFYAEVSTDQLVALEEKRVPMRVLDTDPESSVYHITPGSSISKRPYAIPAGSEPVDELAGATLWRSATAWPEELHTCHSASPFELSARAFPMVHTPISRSHLNLPQIARAFADVDSIVAAVSQDSLYAFDTRLEAFRTRLTFTDSADAALQWILDKYSGFGYSDVITDSFWLDEIDTRYDGWGWAHNAICIKPGTADPDKVIVVGGHWDSIVYGGADPYTFAPGADDNASGTAAAMEIARVLAAFPTKKTIYFMGFGDEESGLHGSWYFAWMAQNVYNTDIACMFNMDMVGHTQDAVPDIEVETSEASYAFGQLTAQMATDHTWLLPNFHTNYGGSSDHAPFAALGYNFVNTIESDFNFAGWHTELDLSTRMDFPYYTEVVKMVAASVYAVAQFPSPIQQLAIWDVGDGQSLRVDWPPATASDITGYRVYWGLSSGNLPNVEEVPGAASDTHTLTGLTEGVDHYISVVAVDTDGNESFAKPEFVGMPLVNPRAPANLTINNELWRLELDWDPAQELDFSHYNVYRGPHPDSLTLKTPNVTAVSYVDSDVQSGVRYYYSMHAVDFDLNESPNSQVVSGIAATFDRGILVIDETHDIAGPPAATQSQTIAAAFSHYPGHAVYDYEGVTGTMDRDIMGQYSAIFWLDDDELTEPWNGDQQAKIAWYQSYDMPVFVAGWRKLRDLSPSPMPSTLQPGDFLYDGAGGGVVDEVELVDCLGGFGQAGFPDVVFDTSKVYAPWNGKWALVNTITSNGVGEVFMTYNSATDNPTYEGQPIGVRNTNGARKVAALGIPVMYLRNVDARTLIDSVASWFGFEPDTTAVSEFPGDVDGNLSVNVVDVVMLIDYLYRLGPVPPSMNGADCNGDCALNLMDVVYLINYVFRSGPMPVAGCVL